MNGMREWWRNKVGRNDNGGDTFRTICLNSSTAIKGTNKMSNTKYTLLTFVPLNLLLQFARFMNVYFLLIATIQLIPAIAPVSPWTIWGPLILVFTISAIKEALDDVKRWRSDKEFNERFFECRYRQEKESFARVVDIGEGNDWGRIKSEDICVGDVLRIKENEEIPCDMVLLQSYVTKQEEGYSSAAVGNDVEMSSSCLVETANIDGETDLKIKQCIPDTAFLGEELFYLSNTVVECEPPNSNIYQFQSRFYSYDNDLRFAKGKSTEDRTQMNECMGTSDALAPPATPLSDANLLLQSTVLRQTEWVFGLVVYVGEETKFSLNKRGPPSKYTNLDRLIDKLTLGVFIGQFIVMLAMGIPGFLLSRSSLSLWYLELPVVQEWYLSLVIPLRFLLLFSVAIPISLKVTIDVIKYAFAVFIESDLNMYCEESDTPAIANNTTLAEDLGQVAYIFADKTGTLTQNVMRVKGAYFNGKYYNIDTSIPGEYHNEEELSICIPEDTDHRVDAINRMEAKHGGNGYNKVGDEMEIRHLLSSSSLTSTLSTSRQNCVEFYRVMALCHSVIPMHRLPGGNGHELDLKWKSSSPDEEALVRAAAEVGMILLKKGKDTMLVSCPCFSSDVDKDKQQHKNGKSTSNVEEFIILATLPFTSERRRMSVLVSTPDGDILLLVKGSDDMLLPRLYSTHDTSGTVSDHPIPSIKENIPHPRFIDAIDSFSGKGLRTLVIAQRKITNEEYIIWKESYDNANALIGDSRVQALDLVYAEIITVNQNVNYIIEVYLLLSTYSVQDSIEVNLDFIGVVAIEDRLQDGVPHTIQSLRKAGIKLWMLTDVVLTVRFLGDKLSTACQIARSCKLLTTQVIGKDEDGIFTKQEDVLNDSYCREEQLNSILNSRRASEKETDSSSWIRNRKETLLNIEESSSISLLERLKDLHRKVFSEDIGPYSLVVEGKTLKNILIPTSQLSFGSSQYSRPKSPPTVVSSTAETTSLLVSTSISSSTAQSTSSSSDYISSSDRYSSTSTSFPIHSPSTLKSKSKSKSKSPSPSYQREHPPSRYSHHSRTYLQPTSPFSNYVHSIFSSCTLQDRSPIRKTHHPRVGMGNAHFLSNRGAQHPRIPHPNFFPIEEFFLFQELALQASTVICCRMSPQQKGSVVSMVQGSPISRGRGDEKGEGNGFWRGLVNSITKPVQSRENITLAIGDGGNDVSMLQEASIGVGLEGREGREAARAADYALGKFRFLLPLLLVHGHLAYHRTAFVAHYCFQKSLYLALLQVWFGIFSGFSGPSLFNSFSLVCYNTIFTGLPIMLFFLDRRYPIKTLLEEPRLYTLPASNRYFNLHTIIVWTARSVYQSCITFYLAYLFYSSVAVGSDGDVVEYTAFSMIVFTIAVLVQTVTLALESNTITIVNGLVLLTTFIGYFIVMIIANTLPFLSLYSVMTNIVFTEPTVFLGILLIVCVAVLPFYYIKLFTINFSASGEYHSYISSLHSASYHHSHPDSNSHRHTSLSYPDSQDRLPLIPHNTSQRTNYSTIPTRNLPQNTTDV